MDILSDSIQIVWRVGVKLDWRMQSFLSSNEQNNHLNLGDNKLHDEMIMMSAMLKRSLKILNHYFWLPVQTLPVTHHSNPICNNREQHRHLKPGNPCKIGFNSLIRWHINFAYFYDFQNGFSNCSDSVIFFVFI